MFTVIERILPTFHAHHATSQQKPISWQNYQTDMVCPCTVMTTIYKRKFLFCSFMSNWDYLVCSLTTAILVKSTGWHHNLLNTSPNDALTVQWLVRLSLCFIKSRLLTEPAPVQVHRHKHRRNREEVHHGVHLQPEPQLVIGSDKLQKLRVKDEMQCFVYVDKYK